MLPIWLLVLFAHFVGDWVLQSLWGDPKNKTDNFVLAKHVAFDITPPLLLVAALVGGVWGPLWVLLNMVWHGATDALTSRMTKYFYQQNGYDSKGFWITIGADQFAHVAVLFWTGGLLVV